VSPGATADQVKIMLRNILVERFKLALHYEKTETQAYAHSSEGLIEDEGVGTTCPGCSIGGWHRATKARAGHRRGRLYLFPLGGRAWQ